MDQRPFESYQQSFALHINGIKLSGRGCNNILRPDLLRQLNNPDGVPQNISHRKMHILICVPSTIGAFVSFC